MMIESNIRTLSRMELIYTCIAKLAVYIENSTNTVLPEEIKHYTDPNDFNKDIYHQRSTDAETRMKQLLEDADKLLESCSSDLEEVTEYELFVRCLTEQTTVENSVRRLRTKEDGTMNSTALQNPSDPEATYRNKGGRSYRGYTANIEESVEKNASVVTDYRYKQNIHSDSSFLKEHLEQMARQEETVSLITDGAYSGTDNAKLAKQSVQSFV